jgi:hypothetical protein
MSTQYRLVQSGKTASGGCSVDKARQSCSASDLFIYISFEYTSSHLFYLEQVMRTKWKSLLHYVYQLFCSLYIFAAVPQGFNDFLSHYYSYKLLICEYVAQSEKDA